ncbi:MAG TPA: iron-sulfur cluster assembly scaffold protein [Rhizomicrobium sp.]|jgi:nitrogen fixation NifU-like protein|nr:iron-sulfur cluster assembly scaffold protein [Rhizomicrobium sp.]
MNDPLYRKEILRLAADAAGAGRLVQPSSSATRTNPACGDRVTVDIAVADGRITALAHHTSACILTQASAAILGADAVGLNRAEIASLAGAVRRALAGGDMPPAPFDAYAAFDGLTQHKARHKCVLLPLEAALEAMEVLELAKPGA